MSLVTSNNNNMCDFVHGSISPLSTNRVCLWFRGDCDATDSGSDPSPRRTEGYPRLVAFPGKFQIATFGQSVGQVWFELHPLDNRALSKPCDITLDDSTVCESCTVTVSTALFTLLKLSLMIPIVRPACFRHCGSDFLVPQHYHHYSWCDNTSFLSATQAQYCFRREFLH